MDTLFKNFNKHVKMGNTIETDIKFLFNNNLNNFSKHVNDGNTIKTDLQNSIDRILKIRF
tara:strand:+ start:1279 stop:1458 length:180 start_codon:yes stop_codon:yes gene_type:complete